MGVVLLRERLDHRRNAGDLQASEIAKTIILVVNGKADVTVLFQSDELSPASENIQNLPSSNCGKICVTVRNIALELHMDLNQCHKLAAQNRFNRVEPYHSPEIRCQQSFEL